MHRQKLFSRIAFPFFLALFLFSGIVGNGIFTPQAHAAALFQTPPAPATTTLGKFLAQKAPALQPFVYPKEQPIASLAKELLKNTPTVLPSSAPIHMTPLQQTLTPTFLSTTATATTTAPVQMQGSDGQLTVSIPAGAIDASGAVTATKTSAASTVQTQGLTLTITQLLGISTGNVDSLGLYQFQFSDAQGHALTGIRLRSAVTIQFHYAPADLQGLGLDPGSLLLTWPEQVNQAVAANASTTGLSVPMSNDATTHTLTAQTTILGTVASVGTGTPSNQAPPKPLLATVQPNTGQLSYAYPITVAPGPNGTTPTVQLIYSSQSTNQRYEPTSPADSPGEGWGVSMGSISATNYPAGSAISGTWYFLSGVDNVSDRLVPTAKGSTTYYTEHVSRLKVQQVTPAGATQPCFHVWDTSGTYYEYGCTGDSLQYSTDSSGTRTNYRWDLDRVTPANEGPGTSTRYTAVSYLQDKNGSTIRDAVIKQITYGTGTSGTALSGTVDFLYKGVTAFSAGGIPFVTAYGTNEGNTCIIPKGGSNTPLRCDDPVNYSGGSNAPTVMSTYSLQTINTYVGGDTYNPPEPDYSYHLNNSEGSYHHCVDARTGANAWCTGEHLLNSITPTVYQSRVGHTLPSVTFAYTARGNTYIDTTQTVSYGKFGSNNDWSYLTSYHDHSSGAGETITYELANNNTHGTPNTGSENRYDPTYCDTYSCTGNFANPNDKAWTVQIVHTITTVGTDSSSSSLKPATTTYSYLMSDWGGSCPADGSGLTNCTGYAWYPKGEGDWQDYYHGEFHGFGWVYITSSSGDLTATSYASTEGWGTAEGYSGNYTSGQMYEHDVYSGGQVDPNHLLSKTLNTYAGNNFTNTSCFSDASYSAYIPCEVVLTQSRTTNYEQTGTSNATAPWVQQDNTYDDYNTTAQFGTLGGYHNLQKQIISSSNAPTLTKKWTYTTTDQTLGTQVYYNVHQVASSEVDDASGHAWQCQDIAYDEGVAAGIPQPAAGWPTTSSSYTNCGNHSAGATLTSYAGYNGNGQAIVGVDARGVSTPSLYSSSGCTPTTAPTYKNSAWTAGHYSSCTLYDVQHGQPTTQTNAFSQSSTTSYDYLQGQIPKSTVDPNGQTTSISYSYDSSGNKTVQVKAPGEAGSYTSQSQFVSTCTDSSVLPCVQEDSSSIQYSGAISRTFYDQLGRAVETQTPSADGSHTIVSFTLYNDATHTVFSSQPFTLTSQTAWVDPNNYGSTPGALTTLDTLGRPLTVKDALGQITSSAYGLGSISGDSNTYATSTGTDANGHVAESFTDALGRTLYSVTNRGKAGGTLTPIRQTSTQYNVLNLPTAITVKDLAPQTGQTITSVTTTAQYDDQGRETSITDPDRGTHSYSYDADGNLISDVSGSRTLGYSYDLLGRVGCVQDSTPTPDVHGACSSGASPFVKNTYDADPSGVTWSGSNYPVGHLTQSVAITYLPGPDYAQGTVTQNWQHDQRGRLITSRLNVAVTGGSLPFPTFPQYQETQTYNDADQPMMTQTSVGGNPGYTTSQAYNGTTGTLTGLSNNGVGVANLATLSYNGQGLIGGMSYLGTDGSPVATSSMSYDSDLRPTGTTATWQNNGTTLFKDQVSYDAVGNVTSRSALEAALPGQNGTGGSEVQNFCYDEQNRLIWASNNAAVPSAGNGTCGNVQYQSTLGGNYTNQYAYTNLGQLWQGPMNGGSTQEQYLYCDSAHPHQLSNLSQTASTPTCSSKGTVDYTGSYDSWGNTTSQVRGGSTRTLSYDGQDHLVRWSSSLNNQEEWNIYDSSGERVLRRTYDGTNTVLTVFAFGEEEHAYSYSGSGSGDTNTSNTYYYTLAGQTLGTWDGTSPNAPTTNFLLTDTLGSVVSSFNNLPNGAAMVLGDQVYGPYGNQRVKQGTMSTSKGFTGQFTDSVAGLDYYGARYYDPVVGVFVSADVVQGNAQGMNPYGYVGGNPETATDPSGNMKYDAATGQVAIPQSNGSSMIIGYTTGLNGTFDSSVTYTPAPMMFQSLVVPALALAVGSLKIPTGQKASPPSAHAAPSQTKPYDIHQPVNPTCGSGLGAICPNTGANLALHFGPFTIGTPIEYNPGNFFPDGGDESGTGGGGNRKETSNDATSCGNLSFTTDTRVATAHGEQAIGTLKVGEQVWSYNPTTKKMEVKPILHVWINHDNDLVDLTITKTTQKKGMNSTHEVIHTNKRHPFLTVEKGFLPVGQIKLGMHVVEANGGVGVISEWKVVPGVMTMYNLEVAQDHTYTVGVGQWVVHNSSCPAGLDPSKLVIVLGRNMEERVKVYAEELRNEGFDVTIYKARSKNPTLDANASWLRYWVNKKGAQVVNIGNDPKDTSGVPSAYYEMEKSLLKRWGTKVFNHDPGY